MSSLIEREAVAGLISDCMIDADLDFAVSNYHVVDAEIRAAFASHHAMYEQGLISAIEYYNRLTQELHAQRS